LLTRTRIKSLPLPPEETGASGPYEASDENKKLLEVLTSEIWKRQVSSSENFDKSVLTLSSGGLAFSLGFLKDFLPVSQAVWGWTLYVSWSALTAATVVTMLSFLAAAKAQDYKLASARLYYLDGDDSRLNDHRWDRAVIWMNRVSGACFVVGVILTTVFVATNLERANDMKNQRPGIGQDGLPSPMMQKISNAGDLRRGLPSPAITPSSPARPVSAPAPAPASTTHSVPVKK
jgi:hypothetical protein